MSKDLVHVYEALNLAEAEAIHQALEAEGIEAYVDQTASPLDGLADIGEGTEVMVREDDAEHAQQVIERYLAQQEQGPAIDEEDGDEPAE